MTDAGIFAQWQPLYAEAGIPTFPVRDKKPAIRGYLKTGPNLSRQLADKFGDAPALGFSCKRAGLTIVDVDTTDETILADALTRYGDTPVIVRSGSGHFQAWYRHSGEGRKIRPDKAVPVDILGGGYVVAPPSHGGVAAYQFLSGSLDDLPSLPRLAMPEAAVPANDQAAMPIEAAETGKRNDTLFRECMRSARRCGSLQEMLGRASEVNATYAPPLPQEEVVAVAQKAWAYEEAGDNRFGGEMTVAPRVSQYDKIERDHFAVSLLMILRRRWRDGETFSAANDMHKPFGFPLRKFVEARTTLERHGLIVMVRKPRKGVGPALYRFG